MLQRTAIRGIVVACCVRATSGHAAALPTDGVLFGRSEPPDSTLNPVNAFLQGLHDLGYTNGQNIAIELQFANWNSERLRELAAELVKYRLDLIAASSTPARKLTHPPVVVACHTIS
jgi:ABC-type uncharacterized transport system substrate-binding protein